MTWSCKGAAPLGVGSVGVVERVDWKRSRLAAQAECSCWPCRAQLGATTQSSFRSSQAPLLGFIVVCREKCGCMFGSSLCRRARGGSC